MGHMSCATDESVVTAADVDVAHCKAVVAGLAPVGGCIVHMAAAAPGKVIGMNEMAYSIAHLIEYGLRTSAKQDSYRSLIVAARIARAAEGQAVEVARQNNHSGIPQVV